ncbi:MAG: hypothetical protein M1828_001651 [Chrysothrix sp. TS-e1954]|nr:MAG: hypothetical protein M1828_001651 [Chrysothrix sp. TS-e1954]
MSFLSFATSRRPSSRSDDLESQQLSTSTLRLPPTAARLLGMAQSQATRSQESQMLMSLERRARDLQKLFQQYLDAQAEGLLANTGRSSDDHRSSTASSNVASIGPNGSLPVPVVPVRQPIKRPDSLREVRQKLWRTMHSLSRTRAEELEHLDATIRPLQTAVKQIDAWEAKRSKLDKEIASIEETGPTVRMDELGQEDRALTDQINAMEMKISELRSQQRVVRLEQGTLQNSLQSRMSSFKGSKAILDKEIKSFLRHPPPAVLHRTNSSDTFLSLPADRRTLPIARDDIVEQERALRQRKEDVDVERHALDEGAAMWKEAASAVISLEKALAQEMANLDAPDETQHEAESATQNAEHKEGMSMLLEHMDTTIQQLETSLRLAETRSWNLLVCCIGAELEALQQGREILQHALGLSEPPTPSENTQEENEIQKTDDERPITPEHPEDVSPAAEMRKSPKEEDPESLLLSGNGDESE